MSNEMNEIKATADAHLQRDLEAGGKWVCECEACKSIRSLEGMDKMLAVRPLMREILATGEKLKRTPDGEEKQGLVELYGKLQDRLAGEMEK